MLAFLMARNHKLPVVRLGLGLFLLLVLVQTVQKSRQGVLPSEVLTSVKDLAVNGFYQLGQVAMKWLNPYELVLWLGRTIRWTLVQLWDVFVNVYEALLKPVFRVLLKMWNYLLEMFCDFLELLYRGVKAIFRCLRTILHSLFQRLYRVCKAIGQRLYSWGSYLGRALKTLLQNIIVHLDQFFRYIYRGLEKMILGAWRWFKWLIWTPLAPLFESVTEIGQPLWQILFSWIHFLGGLFEQLSYELQLQLFFAITWSSLAVTAVITDKWKLKPWKVIVFWVVIIVGAFVAYGPIIITWLDNVNEALRLKSQTSSKVTIIKNGIVVT